MHDTLTREKLIRRVNRKAWWRTALPSKKSIRERGLFFASSFEEAEFYGRPLDTPFRVKITNPIVGSYAYIEDQLLGEISPSTAEGTIKQIFEHDKLLKERAEIYRFDSILVLSKLGHRQFYLENKLPRRMELNLLKPETYAEYTVI